MNQHQVAIKLRGFPPRCSFCTYWTPQETPSGPEGKCLHADSMVRYDYLCDEFYPHLHTFAGEGLVLDEGPDHD